MCCQQLHGSTTSTGWNTSRRWAGELEEQKEAKTTFRVKKVTLLRPDSKNQAAEDWGLPLHLPEEQARLLFGNVIQDSLTGFWLICNNGLAFYPILDFHLCHLPLGDSTP